MELDSAAQGLTLDTGRTNGSSAAQRGVSPETGYQPSTPNYGRPYYQQPPAYYYQQQPRSYFGYPGGY